MNEDRFNELLDALPDEYHAPPPTPREAMWDQIELRRRQPKSTSGRPGAVWGWGLAAAAALVAIGFGFGRFSSSTVPGSPISIAAERTADSVVFSHAAADHLRQLDVFLATFRLEAREGRADTAVAGWARDLLGTTRLMLDSPVARDIELATLLEDLELALVEILGYSERLNDWELALIETGLDESAVQLRVRSRLTMNNDAFTAMGVSE